MFVNYLVKNSEIDEDRNQHFTLVHTTCAMLAIGTRLDFCFADYLVVATALPNCGLHFRNGI